MKGKIRVKGILFLVLLCMLMVGYSKIRGNEKNRTTLYDGDDIDIYYSQLIDTYLIASALHFDFKSSNLISNQNALEEHANAYFEPFKEHAFIEDLEKYVEESAQDISFNVLVPLSSYCYWQEKEEIPEEQLVSNVFQNRVEFEEFLKGLKQFYKDSKANKFFQSEQSYYKSLRKDIKNTLEEKNVDTYMEEMEQYTGNKEKYYNDQNVTYTVLTSLYKPQGASFYQINEQNHVTFICFTSALDDRTKIGSFGIDRMVENAIHEYLHMYINKAVEDQEELIASLAENKNISDYAGSLYQNMPWNRIIDENIVRAVETRIYARVCGDEQKAYDQILKKEIQWGGFQKAGRVYEALKGYENNREQYPMIDLYIPELIKQLLKD